MLEVKIKNVILNKTIDFFYELELRGRQSRHRTKFIKRLGDRLKEVASQQDELLKEHCHLDESGNPKTKNNGREYDVKDLDAFIKERNELYSEEIVFDSGDDQIMLKTIREILDEYDGKLKGEKAVLYDHLCELFRVDEDIDAEIID